MFPDSVESNGSAAVSRIEPLNSHPPDVSAEHLGLDEKPPSDQVMKLEPEETETECQNNASTQPTDGTTEDDATDNDQNDSGEFVVTMLAKAKLEEQGIGVKGRSSPLLEAGTLESSSFTSHRDEDVTADSWRQHRKHVFVLSEAGKPIYSRYGSEEALSSTMGVMMALVSFVQSGDNIIRSVYSGKNVGRRPKCKFEQIFIYDGFFPATFMFIFTTLKGNLTFFKHTNKSKCGSDSLYRAKLLPACQKAPGP